MAPIYDTDIAEERWSQAEWNQYELWEKVEVRLRRRKNLAIFATAMAVFSLFSVPIVADQRPKWETLHAARMLGVELNWMKREASIQHQAFRISFPPGTSTYRIEKLKSCNEPGTASLVREAPLHTSPRTNLTIVRPEQSARLGIPGLLTEYCYDPLVGSAVSTTSPAAIGIISQADSREERTDRLSVVLLSGPSADISFD
ncbi:MAG: hypothetical protein A2X94_15065 [Bdellovibrionales bacterium GWB1_55_8]|nr:MAG: hypothetical protein A2X94_15065 [Bdellovibrionales bacterium GWB1_55_8]